MKKLFFSVFLLIGCCGLLIAQKADLMVKSGDKGLYLEHKVAPRESFFAIGRLYNVSPKFLAAFNKLDLNKGLQIDQKLRIPLTDTNFKQQGFSGTPVYYKIGEKEGLLTVSKKNNNVTLVNLRAWNDLSGEELRPDTKLIIGFLQSKELPSVTITPKTAAEKPVVKSQDPPEEVKPTKEDKKVEEKEGEAEKKAEKKEEKKEEKKKPEPVLTDRPVPNQQGEGYFKTNFEQQARVTPPTHNETVTGSIFKTASGWQDGKYYLMIDNVAAGMIVKITNPTNNKTIYAKVLGEMSGIRQNEGLNIRISNAAASVLDITDVDKFIVRINY